VRHKGPGEAESAAAPEAIEPIAPIDPGRQLTYLALQPAEGDLETGDVMLDGQSIGRLSRRLRAPGPRDRGGAALDPSTDSVWHAEAVGWQPHEGRPWDRRITSTAPTRLRAAEDLLRAYRKQR